MVICLVMVYKSLLIWFITNKHKLPKHFLKRTNFIAITKLALPEAVCYALGRLIMRRTTTLSTNMSPYQLLMGTRLNYRKSLSLGFGDYCEVFDGSDNDQFLV
jgi:hypothetical protein